MKITDTYITSSTGVDKLRVRVWEPEGEVRSLLQIAHGVAEHVERYDDFAGFLTDNGIKVVAGDHLGHGKSIREIQGYFADSDGWNYVVKDLKLIFDAYHSDSIPHFFMGHSMGSFLLRTFLIQYPAAPMAGAIISGTGNQSPAVVAGGRLVCKAVGGIKGYKAVSGLMNGMAFGSYNKKTQNRTAYDWLSTDDAQVDRYVADPLCGFPSTTGLIRDMLGGIAYIQNKANLAKMNKALPVVFFSGSDDPVGNYGAGVQAAYDSFIKAGMKNATIKLFPGCRHELLNETNNQEAYEYLLNWINNIMLTK